MDAVQSNTNVSRSTPLSFSGAQTRFIFLYLVLVFLLLSGWSWVSSCGVRERVRIFQENISPYRAPLFLSGFE